MDTSAQSPCLAAPSEAQVGRAIRLSYAQVMLAAVFGASTGGMFLIGFALQLGADNITLGLLSSIPALFVVLQFLAAWLVERGVSRKSLTVWFAFVGPLCWVLIGLIPLFHAALGARGSLAVLIGVIVLVTVAGQFAGNARGSWIGDLIPAERRGKFFGYCGMFAGVVGALFAIGEGRVLDYLKVHGLWAFSGLFFFGVLFGLATASLHIPQPDCPLPATRQSYGGVLRDLLRNRELKLLAAVHAVVALAGIVGPFIPTYWLRDLKFGFFELGIINATFTAAALLCSPLWGKAVDRWGCRPVMIMGFLIWGPQTLFWLLVPPDSTLRHAMTVLLVPFFLSGVGASAFSIGITSLLYKVTKPEGRSIQFAAYSAFVTAIGAPMPVIGAWLVKHLQESGMAVDLRLTIYLHGLLVTSAALVAAHVREPASVSTRTLVFRYLPQRLSRLWDSLVPW
jgi:MFS family permease